MWMYCIITHCVIDTVDEAAAAERAVTCTAKMFNRVSEHKDSVSGLIQLHKITTYKNM